MSNKKEKRINRLENLQERWVDCRRCAFHKERNNVLFWRGNPCAKIMLIDEAPGEAEDVEATPFVGKPGKELFLMLEECGLEKKHVFMASFLGCRPPSGVGTEFGNIEKCKPRIERMIQIVKPKVVILLGGQAAFHMGVVAALKTSKGKVLRGLTTKGHEYKMVVTYHPSYYLRRGRKQEIWDEIVSHIEMAIGVV